MHSLHYLLPLLRRGVKTGNKDMIDRFYFLIHDWFQRQQARRPDQPLRLGTADLRGLPVAGARVRRRRSARRRAVAAQGVEEAGRDGRRARPLRGRQQRVAAPADGAVRHRRHARPAGLAQPRARSASRVLAARLIHADGSDEEGALNYAQNNYRWFNQAAERMRRAGDAVPAGALPRRRDPGVHRARHPPGRPDRGARRLRPDLLGARRLAGTAAEWAATGGASGVRAQRHDDRATPAATSSAAVGLGQRVRPLADETYYSVRAGQGNGIPHAHDDAGSLTLYSYGSPLLLDTGQWEYRYGTTRQLRGVPRRAQRRHRRRRRAVAAAARAAHRAGHTGWTSRPWSTAATAAWRSPAPSPTTGSRTSCSSGTG